MILDDIVGLVENSTWHIEDGTLYCNNFTITDVNFIEYLESNSILENIIEKKQIGEKINLELNLVRLNSEGFYESLDAFILKNKYNNPKGLYYLNELKKYNNEPNDFSIKYNSTLRLINSIIKLAKHSYTDLDVLNAIIFREDQSLYLPFIYKASDIRGLSKDQIDLFDSTAKIFEDVNSEKKLLFINELLNQLNTFREDERFVQLLSGIANFNEKCNNAYQFYLRDFSYNKLTLELDSKALDFTQKIQSVINDSQTKLIAIPTAFVFVAASFDFENLSSIKNTASILSLFIFAILIQLFLNNQKSTLDFIAENIYSFKNTFKNSDIAKISSKFSLVEIELKKQIYRLSIIELILWTIPVSFSLIWLYLLNHQFICNCH